MKKLISIIKHGLRSCHVCHGMGTKELPNGDTVECPACKGRGLL